MVECIKIGVCPTKIKMVLGKEHFCIASGSHQAKFSMERSKVVTNLKGMSKSDTDLVGKCRQ